MVATIIAYFATALASVALGYYWGKHDGRDDGFAEGVVYGTRINQSVLVHLNTKIRDLEHENDQLYVRLEDGSGTNIEDQYITEED